MSDPNTSIESLLADILDESKPLPTPEKVEHNTKVNAAGGPFAAMSNDPDDFLAGLMPEVTQVCNTKPEKPAAIFGAARRELEIFPPPIEEEEGVVIADVQAASPVEIFTDSQDRDEEQIKIKMPVFTSPDLAATMDIRNFATLVTLNTSRWHAKVKDRQASKDAAIANDAVEDAFETRKRLLVGADDLLRAIHKSIDEARAKHYEMTLPWTTTGMDDVGRRTGGRLLPNTLFFEYTSEMASCKSRMQQALDAFVPAYPNLVQVARAKLGKRFDPREYPNQESIRGHFDMSFDFQPVPKGDDFKGLPQQQLDALARHLNQNTQTMAENAMQDVWIRLREVVERMADRLSSPDKLFHHTLITNVRDVARLLTHLNITNDPRVESIRKKVEKQLCAHDASVLRENPVLRNTVGAHAVSILQEMDK